MMNFSRRMSFRTRIRRLDFGMSDSDSLVGFGGVLIGGEIFFFFHFIIYKN